MSNCVITLNHYQQLMLRLSHLAPYNAVHSGAIDKDKNNLLLLENSINIIINQILIGIPAFSPDYQHVRFRPLTERVRLETCMLSLQEHTENEMDYFFSTNEFPLRFFIISDPPQCYFSITYNHWIGDACTISCLMEAIFTHLNNAELPKLTLEVPKIEACFKPIYQKKVLYYRYLGVIQSIMRFSKGFRTKISNIENTDSGCHVHFFEKDLLQQLILICKQYQITLNDLFVTVLALVFGHVTQNKREKVKQKFLKPKRDHIIIGVISNIRTQSSVPLSNKFGLFLGFFYLSFKSPEKYLFRTLCKDVCYKTTRLKRKNAAIKQYLLFQVQKTIWDKTKRRESKYRLFSKNIPITVGISNMNLTKSHESLSNNVKQYIRFSPTAMVCPIVFNMTTFNECLSLGINFRKACYTSEEVEQIKNAFIMEINQLIQAQ